MDALSFGPWGPVAYEFLGAPLEELLVVGAGIYVLSLVVPAGLAHAYARLPEGMLGRRALLRRVIPWLAGGIGLWTTLLTVMFSHTSYIASTDRVGVVLWCLAHTTFLLGGWTALYFLPALGRRVRQARERELQMTALANEAQLAALRAQLRPHFLFNSINSVIGLMEEDAEHAKDMMRDVAALLRRALATTRTDHSTLGEELAFVAQYLRCERVRFGDDLRAHVDVPPELHALPLPSMLLQPLVENAVKHGMPGAGPVEVVVRGRREPGGVRLEVRNTGQLGKASAEGAGLRLVRERLRARFGPLSALSLQRDEGWVVARLWLPVPEERTGTMEEADRECEAREAASRSLEELRA
ncbi:MAG: histidine kinase [Myxococcota bacterium]